MNYKYLSKYHYIYRLSIGGDRKAHVEKIPIAYANKHYIYVREAGSDHLRELSLAPTGSYFRGVIYTKLDQAIKERIVNHLIDECWANRGYGGIVGRQLWFLLDDPNELQKFTEELSMTSLPKLYLTSEKKRLVEALKNANERVQIYIKDLKEIEGKLAEVEGKINADS